MCFFLPLPKISTPPFINVRREIPLLEENEIQALNVYICTYHPNLCKLWICYAAWWLRNGTHILQILSLWTTLYDQSLKPGFALSSTVVWSHKKKVFMERRKEQEKESIVCGPWQKKFLERLRLWTKMKVKTFKNV